MRRQGLAAPFRSQRGKGNPPTFFADFTSGTLPSNVTLTRASNALQFDSAGNLVYAPANMAPATEDVGGTGWSATTCNNPSTGLLIPNAVLTTHGANGIANIVLGQRYFIAFSAKAAGYNYFHLRGMGNSGTGLVFDVSVGTTSGAAGWSNVSCVDEGDGWFRCSGEWTATSTTPFQLFISPDGTFNNYSGDLVSGMYVNKAQITPLPNVSTAYIQNTSTSAYYGPRFDYEPATHSMLGILLEEPRTNLNPRNMMEGASGLNLNGVTGSAQTWKGWSLARVTADGLSASHFVYTSTVIPAATTVYTVSGVVGFSTNDLVQLALSGNFAALDCYINVNTSTGAIVATGAGASNAFSQDLGDGYWRIGFTFTSSAAPTGGAAGVFGIIQTSTDLRLPIFVSSDAVTCGALQFEAGTFATSIIPTFGATATRAVDNCAASTGAFYTTSGTLFARYSVAECMPVTQFPNVITFDDGTLANRVILGGTLSAGNLMQSNVRIDTAGVVEANYGAGPSVNRINVRGAFSYATNNVWATTNGAGPTQDNLAAIPAGLSNLSFGRVSSGNTNSARWIAQVAYYDTVMTNAQLMAMTA